MRCVLVLGGAGFIGTHLISQLLVKIPSIHIYSIGRGELQNSSEKVHHYSSSINLQKLEQCFGKDHNAVQFDVVFNCAGSGSVGLAKDNPLSDFQDTLCSLYESLEYLRQNTANASFVQLSTAAVYGNAERLPIKVDSKLSPISTYGYTNVMAERAIELYANVYGIKGRSLRLFSVYGPGLRKQLLWDACKKLTMGDAQFFGTGREIRDWIHIEDAVNQIIWAAQEINTSKSAFNVYNCASGVGVENKAMLEIISREFDIGSKTIKFSGVAKEGDPLGYVAQLEFDAPKCNIELEKGVVNYVNWFKAQ